MDLQAYGFTLDNLLYFIAGSGSTAVRAWRSEKQNTFSWKSLTDVMYGGLSALVFPAFFPGPVAALNMIAKAGAVAVLSFVTNWAYTAAAWKMGWLAPLEPPPPQPIQPQVPS